MKKYRINIFWGICLAGLGVSCQKGFLDQRPDKALLVPATTADMQALLDNTDVFNTGPGLTFIADGDMWTTDAGYNAYNTDMERNSYTWSKDIFAGQSCPDWNIPYQQVFYANVVLEGLAKLPRGNTDALSRNLKGTALFDRALAFYNLAQLFCAPYDPATAAATPGIPVRLTADVNSRLPRASLQEVMDQVLADLDAAGPLLPFRAAYKSRPTVAARWALLSRIYLGMGNYGQAEAFADSVLAAGAVLIDYNTLSRTATRPFPRALPDGNDEVIFYQAQSSYSFANAASPTFLVPELYGSYAVNDLRGALFGRQLTPGNFKFKGTYAGSLLQFSGLATDELLLVRAECRARRGELTGAMGDLNALLVKRWAAGTFQPYRAVDAADALRQVLQERRKELVGRGLRWADLRRLNRDPLFRLRLSRSVGGKDDTLEPGSPRYVYPIPEEEIRLGGLVQNER